MKEKEIDNLQRVNRILVWLTLILFIGLVLSGFGMTNPEVTTRLTGGIFSTTFSMYLHANLAVPVLILLLIHVLVGMKTVLTRWGVKEGWLLNTCLVALGLFAAALIILMRYLTF